MTIEKEKLEFFDVLEMSPDENKEQTAALFPPVLAL